MSNVVQSTGAEESALHSQILSSGLFDIVYYSNHTALHFDNSLLAISHFLNQPLGALANPSELFDVQWYLATYPDVAAHGTNPLVHYVKFGCYEGRKCRPEPITPILQAIDALISSGAVSDAYQQLSGICSNSALLNDAVAMRLVKLDYFKGDAESGFARISLLSEHWSKLTHPAEFNELLRIRVYWLAELGELAAARQLLLAQIQGNTQWNCYLEWYRDLVDSEQELARYQDLLAGFWQDNSLQSAQALLLYAYAARRAGNFNAAFSALSRRITILVKQHSLPEKNAGLNWASLAVYALKSLKAELEKRDIPFFLVSGTLLGCIRDNAILPHDKDIDVGVLEGTDLSALAVQLRASGVFLVKHQKHPAILQLQHINGVLIDIFMHWQEDDKLVHSGQKAVWLNATFTLQPYAFLDDEYLIPAPAERYLTENYVDWQQPKTDYDTFVDTPNMRITDRDDMLFHYLKVLPEHYAKGHYGVVRRIWRCMTENYAVQVTVKVAYWRAMLKLMLQNVLASR